MIGTIEDASLVRLENTGALTWRDPLLMLVARSAFAIVAQALVAVIFAFRSSPAPWHDAEPWMPVYGTLIDLGWRGSGSPFGPPHQPFGRPKPRADPGAAARKRSDPLL